MSSAMSHLRCHLQLNSPPLQRMSKSTITKVRRRLRRKRSLMRSQRLFLLLLALVFSILFVLRRYASHSPDPFSVKVYFPGWRTHPVVLDSPITLDNQQVDTSGPLYMLELRSAKTISDSYDCCAPCYGEECPDFGTDDH